MSIGSIYVNLPIKNVEKTRQFWTALGFPINEQFSDEKAVCVELKKDLIYAMMLSESFFKTFTHKPIADGGSTQMLLAIQVESKERVDEILSIALSLGAIRYLDPIADTWMYYDRFQDLDGHQWEVMYADMSQFPQEQG
ncbi:MAG: extradiol dioxygenase [Clostridiales bacterium 38-18]|nr:MAG: extradiol dioxygenase [Clostridiales bacterium 38-18]